MRDELLQRGAQISDVLEDGLHVRTGVIRVRTYVDTFFSPHLVNFWTPSQGCELGTHRARLHLGRSPRPKARRYLQLVH